MATIYKKKSSASTFGRILTSYNAYDANRRPSLRYVPARRRCFIWVVSRGNESGCGHMDVHLRYKNMWPRATRRLQNVKWLIEISRRQK